MNKKEFDNTMARQAKLAPSIVDLMMKKFQEKKIIPGISVKEIFDVNKIIITGCGDSWLAGKAMKPIFEKVVKMETIPMRNIEFTRYLDSKMLGYTPNNPLVVAISVSGNVSRVVEALKRANHYGSNTILITNNPQSPAAKEAKHLIELDLPKGEYNPGLNSYVAVLVALMNLAFRFAEVRNTVSRLEIENMKKAILDYASSFNDNMEYFDDRAFEIAKKWKDLRAFDFIGDYADYATGYFLSAKVIECFGGYTTYDDSEGWCHINYFTRKPETIGRVVVTNSDTPSFSRMKETLVAVEQLESPCIVLTDADKSEFPASFEVFTTPKPEYFWIAPLLQHIPFDFIAGYIMELKGVKSFRTDLEAFGYESGAFRNRITKSKIEII